jgi:hypothetical protein
MNGRANIQYLPHQSIDKRKWDDCITRSANGLIYGYSFYLDHMSRQWDALVLGDYEVIMPLTWNSKWNIHYLYQPFLTAQLGVFGNALTPELLESFLKKIPSKFRYWDFYLNQGNLLQLKEFDLYERSNFVLNLNKPYEELYGAYRENIQRNIKRAQQTGCTGTKDFEADKVIELAVEQMRAYSDESANNVERFRKLYYLLHQQKQAITYGILSASGQLISSAVFLYSHNRAYYILVGNHPDGRTIGASHALIDYFIKDHANKPLLLDFEGSDIRNLAFFYSSFGATMEKFAGIKLNRLPFYLKWLKK